jgi:CDP-glycerol glycerophosphotransferase (TagB/SpsB family)
LDANADYTESYSLADLMVTDLSGTGFTFSFSFGRPTIYFAPDAEAERGLSGLQFDARHRIGALVRDIDGLIGKTAELCHRDMSDEIERFRDETVFNVGKSAAYIVDCLENILSGCERPEWVRL